MDDNTLYAVKRTNHNFIRLHESLEDNKKQEWWAVIDCGVTQVGGFTTGKFWSTHFKKEGRTYRWYQQLFMPPENLVEWQEITIIIKEVAVVSSDSNHNAFTGWNDREDGCYETLAKFAKLLGKDLTNQEVKDLINTTK